jgi:hypothetical protein
VRTPSILLLGALLSSPLAAQVPDRAATVVGTAVDQGALAAGVNAEAGEARLMALIWPRIASHYVASHGLTATPAEIEEVLAYNREFERRDRAQRARKVEELKERLAKTGLAPQERAWLKEFQATLLRLAHDDDEQVRMPPQDPERLRALAAQWVESWKMNRALYERYGGVVGLSEIGLSPHGARAALIADYECQGLLEFGDAAVRGRVYAMLRRTPRLVVPPDSVDFTPFWKRPIPPSYFPE